MSDLIRIDDEIISEEKFIKILKLSNEYNSFVEKLIRNKITVNEAKKRDIQLSDAELQELADIDRRARGLYRAKDTLEWMNDLGISIEDYQNFIADRLYQKKMIETIATDETVESYFKLNSPQFDKVDIKIIVTDSEDKAKELKAIIEDDPESFDELVQAHTIDDNTRKTGGRITGIKRGETGQELTAKLFNAAPGDILGPFPLEGQNLHQIIMVTDVYPAKLDNSTKVRITERIYDEWLQARLEEHIVKNL